MNRKPEMMTITDIAEELGMPPQRVAYTVASRGIKPAGRVGATRFWHRQDLARIRQARRDIARTPQGRPATLGG